MPCKNTGHAHGALSGLVQAVKRPLFCRHGEKRQVELTQKDLFKE